MGRFIWLTWTYMWSFSRQHFVRFLLLEHFQNVTKVINWAVCCEKIHCRGTYGSNEKKRQARHLHCPYTQTEGPEEPGAQNCTQPRCALCDHHACTKSQPWGQHHWWCSPAAPPKRAGSAPHWTTGGPQWFVSAGKKVRGWIRTGGGQMQELIIYLPSLATPRPGSSRQGVQFYSLTNWIEKKEGERQLLIHLLSKRRFDMRRYIAFRIYV